jgi:hypothetical protein
MAFKQTLPAPTWSGFEAECLGKFLNFVVKRRLKGNSRDAERIERKIYDLQQGIRELREFIDSWTGEAEDVQSDLDVIEADIASLPVVDDDTLEVMLKSITDLPYVTGLSAHQVLTVRVALRQKWLYAVDLGEVEFHFSEASEGWFLVKQVRKPWGVSGIHFDEDGRSESGWLRVDTSGDISTTIDNIRRQLEFFNKRGAWRHPFTSRPLRSEPLEFDVQAIKPALKRAVVKGAGWRVERRERLKERLVQIAKDIEDSRQAIRGNNTQLRTLRTQLARLKNGGENIVVNLQEVADELRRIIALPGVMGLRFKKNGTPVFHVRASHLYRGRRYDVGDFEVRFKLFEDGDDGALNVYGTRVRRGNFYYHREDSASTSWFCFGNRAQEAQDMFRGGHYAAMMGLLINSMNSINTSDRSVDGLREGYHEIPVDLVWKPALVLNQADLTAVAG